MLFSTRVLFFLLDDSCDDEVERAGEKVALVTRKQQQQ